MSVRQRSFLSFAALGRRNWKKSPLQEGRSLSFSRQLKEKRLQRAVFLLAHRPQLGQGTGKEKLSLVDDADMGAKLFGDIQDMRGNKDALSFHDVFHHDGLDDIGRLRIQARQIMRCDSDSGKKLIKSMVLRTADRQGMC